MTRTGVLRRHRDRQGHRVRSAPASRNPSIGRQSAYRRRTRPGKYALGCRTGRRRRWWCQAPAPKYGTCTSFAASGRRFHRPAGSQSPPPVVRMRRSTGPRIPYVRPVPGLGVVGEATPAQPRAALGLPHDSVRCWLRRPRQRGSGGSGSEIRDRPGGEAGWVLSSAEASRTRCYCGNESRHPQPRSPASRGRCASSGTHPRRRARSPGAGGADSLARSRGCRAQAKATHAAASRSHGRRKVP